jgi:hypothetical protein
MEKRPIKVTKSPVKSVLKLVDYVCIYLIRKRTSNIIKYLSQCFPINNAVLISHIAFVISP